MNTIKVFTVLSIVGLWWSAALCQHPKPVDTSTGRYQRPGYSVLPPSGKNWYVAPAEQAGPSAVMFEKKPSRAHPLQTYLVSVSSTWLEEPQSTPETLLEFVKRELGVVPDPKRFQNTRIEAELDEFHGVTCVKTRLTQEDHAAPYYGKQVAIIEDKRIVCPHPASPRLMVIVLVSRRYPAKDIPEDLIEEIRPFLDSLTFTDVVP